MRGAMTGSTWPVFQRPASGLSFLAYRPELVAVTPRAVLLAGAWQQKGWALPGLCIGALVLPLLS
jgi:hypothetical protein